MVPGNPPFQVTFHFSNNDHWLFWLPRKLEENAKKKIIFLKDFHVKNEASFSPTFVSATKRDAKQNFVFVFG